MQAGLPTVITPNNFTAGHDFTGALRVLPSLLGVTVAHLREWHGLRCAVEATGASQNLNYRENPHAFVQAVHAHPIPD